MENNFYLKIRIEVKGWKSYYDFEILDELSGKKKRKTLDELISHILLIQVLGKVRGGSMTDDEEGVKACCIVAKLWMAVRSSSLRFIAL